MTRSVSKVFVTRSVSKVSVLSRVRETHRALHGCGAFSRTLQSRISLIPNPLMDPQDAIDLGEKRSGRRC